MQSLFGEHAILRAEHDAQKRQNSAEPMKP